MIRVIVICEGQTERDFCRTILAPFYREKSDILIQAPLIKKTKGGIVKWDVLKKQILQHLKHEPDAYVTTFIDYYGLYGCQFPYRDEAEAQPNKYNRLSILEKGMKEEVEDTLRYRFFPYIQLHEFEALLFNEKDIFYINIPKEDIVNKEELDSTFNEYKNPEMINDIRESSPSHRLARIISGYDKIVHGCILAEAIGLDKMREKSPHFHEWLSKIEQLITL